jgi:hypothetical protein
LSARAAARWQEHFADHGRILAAQGIQQHPRQPLARES